MRKSKNIIKSILFLILISIGVICFCSYWIQYRTKDKLYTSIYDIPYNHVGVVLGTSKSLKTGQPNPYFYNRIDAAAALYHAGKIDRLVISGDNSDIYYNEPRDMKKALVERGVNPNHLFIDAAGLRTLDSIVRMKLIFRQNKYTVISQKFHNERAVFLASVKAMDVIGFNAKDVELAHGLKVQSREKLARVKVFLDLLFDKQPKYLGKPIDIE